MHVPMTKVCMFGVQHFTKPAGFFTVNRSGQPFACHLQVIVARDLSELRMRAWQNKSMLVQKEVTPATISSSAVYGFAHSASCSAVATADSCTIGASSSELSELDSLPRLLLDIRHHIEDHKRTSIGI